LIQAATDKIHLSKGVSQSSQRPTFAPVLNKQNHAPNAESKDGSKRKWVFKVLPYDNKLGLYGVSRPTMPET